MIDISKKFSTLRTAIAHARVHMHPDTISRVKANDVPKQNPLVVAQWAGIQAAKKTSELIPACHPVPIDYCVIEFAFDDTQHAICITATVKAEYKTGVEMEALTAASVAALTLYDMLKPIDDAIEIASIRLIEKHGGIKQSAKEGTSSSQYRTAVVVVSDSLPSGKQTDPSAEAASESLTNAGFAVGEVVITSDDLGAIKDTFITLCNKGYDVVIATGGTGLGPRDCTCRAVREVSEREAVGIGEWVRAYGRVRTPSAILSNSTAGIRASTLIIALPGGTRAVTESLEALKPILTHALRMIRGSGHAP